MQTEILLGNWNQTSFFVRQALSILNDDNAAYRLQPSTSSAGFLLQHISESGVLLVNSFFNQGIEFSGVTLNGARDEGQTGNTEYVTRLYNAFDQHVIDALTNSGQFPHTHQFESFLGPKTAAESLAIIAYHTNYHLGQAQLTLKRGKVYATPVLA